jgi:hypothetical protein
LTYIQIHSL